ncbi:ABC transporter2C periplasmic substrate-binding protein2C putative [gamma proteobacterium IMCC2047]|nr:ABC transporter2C periplasmic substrate-binding protein2C putative [gamma proteobacterium IMCC2047]
MGITRRNLLRGTAAGIAVAGTGFSTQLLAGQKTVKIGLNIPMTGDYAPWGLPGLYGCNIVANNINAAGGVEIGGETYMIEPVGYDHGYDTEKAITGYNTLRHDDAAMIMMLGGSTVGSIIGRAQRNKMLVSTLLPSDITPDTSNLVAPSESHPLYNCTGVDWLADNFPDAKSAVIVTTNDIEYGQQSAAVYQAAFEARGIEVLDTNFHGFDVTDFAPIVQGLLASKPDIFCMATDVYTTPLIEALYNQGYEGKIISCTLDLYDEVIAKTSKEFVEGIIFQFPDFDDPALQSDDILFPDPSGFWDTFQKDYPGQWSAVAWEYPANLVTWVSAAQAAGSIEPMDVLAAMKANPNPPHVFGTGKWWGKDLYGLDNCVVGRWPVVTMQNGRARIVEFRDVGAWLDKNLDILKRKMQDLGLRTV